MFEPIHWRWFSISAVLLLANLPIYVLFGPLAWLVAYLIWAVTMAVLVTLSVRNPAIKHWLQDRWW